MDRPNRMPQLYGYTVCLVALVTVLITVPAIVDNLFTLSNPAQSDNRFGFGGSLGSFEAYRASQREGRGVPAIVGGKVEVPDTPVSDAELRRRYDALHADQVTANEFQAHRSLVRNGLLLALAVGLFASHWGWLRRQPNGTGAGGAAA